MKGYVFDPSRLAHSARQQERNGYAMAARLLRDLVGTGDIVAEVRARARGDPKLREMLQHASSSFREAAANLPVATSHPRSVRRRRA